MDWSFYEYFYDTFDDVLYDLFTVQHIISYIYILVVLDVCPAMFDQDRIIKSVQSCQVNKCKDEKGQWKASVLGTVFRCSVLGHIQVSYDIFAGVYVQAMCGINVLLLNAWGWQTSISSIFSRLPCSELGSPARKQVWKGSEIGWKHLAPTPHLLSPSIHQSINHNYTLGNMLACVHRSRFPEILW